MNFVVNDDFILPKDSIAQIEIFLNQLNKYIKIDSTVAILSAFPIFLFDYYGHDVINELIQTKE